MLSKGYDIMREETIIKYRAYTGELVDDAETCKELDRKYLQTLIDTFNYSTDNYGKFVLVREIDAASPIHQILKTLRVAALVTLNDQNGISLLKRILNIAGSLMLDTTCTDIDYIEKDLEEMKPGETYLILYDDDIFKARLCTEFSLDDIFLAIGEYLHSSTITPRSHKE